MTTVNEYMENTRDNRIANLLMTIAFLILPISGYATLHFQQSYLMLYLSIFFNSGLLLIFLIKPAYKILKGNALWWEMKNLTLAPFGIGLLRIYWPPYQRMARKLANEEAIQGCENALNIMERDFESGWEQFREWFPNIEASDETHKKRYELVKSMLYACIKQKRNELEDEFRVATESIKSILLLGNEDVAEFLKKEEVAKAAYPRRDVSQKAFDLELEKRSYELFRTREMLFISNTDWVFEEMCKIQN